MGYRAGPPQVVCGRVCDINMYLRLSQQGHTGPGVRFRRQTMCPRRRKARRAMALSRVVRVCVSPSFWKVPHFDQFWGRVGQPGWFALSYGTFSVGGGRLC